MTFFTKSIRTDIIYDAAWRAIDANPHAIRLVAKAGIFFIFQDSTQFGDITATSRRASNCPFRAVCFEFFRLVQHQ